MATRVIVLIALYFVSRVAAAQTPGLPVVRVVGPLPVSAASYPFGAADHTRVSEDLKKVGYVEEEFLASGVADVYDWTSVGPARVRTADAPYTTRVLIRRPADRARFSGTAILEPLNPSNRFDLNIGWAISHAQFVRNGDAWGRHVEAGFRRGDEGVQSDALRLALVGESAFGERPAELHQRRRR